MEVATLLQHPIIFKDEWKLVWELIDLIWLLFKDNASLNCALQMRVSVADT